MILNHQKILLLFWACQRPCFYDTLVPGGDCAPAARRGFSNGFALATELPKNGSKRLGIGEKAIHPPRRHGLQPSGPSDRPDHYIKKRGKRK